MIRSLERASAGRAADVIEALDPHDHPAVIVAMTENADVVVRALRHYAADLTWWEMPDRFDFSVSVCCAGETGNGPGGIADARRRGNRRYTVTVLDMENGQKSYRSECQENILHAVDAALRQIDPPVYLVEDYMKMPGGRFVGYIRNPMACQDFNDWSGRTVCLAPAPGGKNGCITVECLGIERYLHAPPFRVGESIGVLFKWPLAGEDR